MIDKPKAKMTRAEAIECFEKHMPDVKQAGRTVDFYIEAGMLEIVEDQQFSILLLKDINNEPVNLYIEHIIAQLSKIGYTISK